MVRKKKSIVHSLLNISRWIVTIEVEILIKINICSSKFDLNIKKKADKRWWRRRNSEIKKIKFPNHIEKWHSFCTHRYVYRHLYQHQHHHHHHRHSPSLICIYHVQWIIHIEYCIMVGVLMKQDLTCVSTWISLLIA